MNTINLKPIKIAIVAMGGQGGGVLSDWIVSLAERANYLCQATSVPGVAQRTGATVYYLELIPTSTTLLEEQVPVLALMPVPGDIDIVIAGELVEAGRAVSRGFVSKEQTTVISSSHRDFAISEKAHLADGRVDSGKIIQILGENSRRFINFDMDSLAKQSSSLISSVLFGALAGANVLPFSRGDYEEVIIEHNVAIESNLKGFEAGYIHVSTGISPVKVVPENVDNNLNLQETSKKITRILEKIKNVYPVSSHDILIEALRKLIDYQDIRYGESYLEMLEDIYILDKQNGGNNQNYTITREVARYLALWMTYEDTIRVADLKIRRSRFDRIKKEIKVAPGQLITITEFMHPRVEEVCDTLPSFFAKLVLNNKFLYGFVGLFCKKGRKIKTSSVCGYLMLFCVANFRVWRRRTFRYGIEMNNIKLWLKEIKELIKSNKYALALEVVECQRLIKGYGETHARGTKNFKRIMQVLHEIKYRNDAPEILFEMRNAALADEEGENLNKLFSKYAIS